MRLVPGGCSVCVMRSVIFHPLQVCAQRWTCKQKQVCLVEFYSSDFNSMIDYQYIENVERKKRAEILESEGEMQSFINIAEGKKRAIQLQAEGEAASIKAKADATAIGLQKVAESVMIHAGSEVGC